MLWAIFGLCAAAQVAPPGTSDVQRVLWARLETPLNSGTLKIGDTVRARMERSWSSPHCMIFGGSTVQGRVELLRPRAKGAKVTAVTLHFTVACVEGHTVSATLIALLYPNKSTSKGQMDTYMDMPMGIGPGASGRQSTDVGALPSPSYGKVGPEPTPQVRIGQVTGVRHVTLHVPSQAGADSVLATPDKRLELQAGTRLAFRVDIGKP